MTRTTLVAAAVESATDNIGSGWCGRGMLSILKNAGLGKGLGGRQRAGLGIDPQQGRLEAAPL